MTNIYNKGRFRNREWAKHLRSFLKKEGNRRWRSTGRSLEFVAEEENEGGIERAMNYL